MRRALSVPSAALVAVALVSSALAFAAPASAAPTVAQDVSSVRAELSKVMKATNVARRHGSTMKVRYSGGGASTTYVVTDDRDHGRKRVVITNKLPKKHAVTYTSFAGPGAKGGSWYSINQGVPLKAAAKKLLHKPKAGYVLYPQKLSKAALNKQWDGGSATNVLKYRLSTGTLTKATRTKGAKGTRLFKLTITGGSYPGRLAIKVDARGAITRITSSDQPKAPQTWTYGRRSVTLPSSSRTVTAKQLDKANAAVVLKKTVKSRATAVAKAANATATAAKRAVSAADLKAAAHSVKAAHHEVISVKYAVKGTKVVVSAKNPYSHKTTSRTVKVSSGVAKVV